MIHDVHGHVIDNEIASNIAEMLGIVGDELCPDFPDHIGEAIQLPGYA